MLNLSHKKLEVYKTSLLMLKEVYLIVKLFPKEETYNLSSQLRRAAVSVCSNIAEGAARFSKLEKKRFYEVARSSVVEIDTQIEIARSLHYASPEQLEQLEINLESVFKMLSKMITNFQNPINH